MQRAEAARPQPLASGRPPLLAAPDDPDDPDSPVEAPPVGAPLSSLAGPALVPAPVDAAIVVASPESPHPASAAKAIDLNPGRRLAADILVP